MPAEQPRSGAGIQVLESLPVPFGDPAQQRLQRIRPGHRPALVPGQCGVYLQSRAVDLTELIGKYTSHSGVHMFPATYCSKGKALHIPLNVSREPAEYHLKSTKYSADDKEIRKLSTVEAGRPVKLPVCSGGCWPENRVAGLIPAPGCGRCEVGSIRRARGDEPPKERCLSVCIHGGKRTGGR